jgi:hypothetical protein
MIRSLFRLPVTANLVAGFFNQRPLRRQADKKQSGRMDKTQNQTEFKYIAALFLILWSSCTQEPEFVDKVNIQATFRLKSRTAMDGKIQIGETLLKLDRIQASGNLGKSKTDVIHSIHPDEPPYRLSMTDTAQVRFTLNSMHYDELDFHLFLLQDPYELILKDGVVTEVPAPGQTDDHDGVSDGDGNQEEENDEADDDSDQENGEIEDGGNDQHDGGGQAEDDKDDEGDDDDGNDKGDGGDDGDDGDDDNNGKGKGKQKGKNKNGEKDKGKGDDDEDDDGRKSGESNRQVIIDLDDFFQHARPGMVVMATYENNGKTIYIIFVASEIEKFTVRAKQNDSFAISLSEESSAEISFDPAHWFSGLTPAQIESADIQIYQQQNLLLIHKDFNTALYEEIASRIGGSAYLSIAKGTPNDF